MGEQRQRQFHPVPHRLLRLPNVLALQHYLPHIDRGQRQHRGGHRLSQQLKAAVPEEHHVRRVDGVVRVHHGLAAPVHLVIALVGPQGIIQAAGSRQALLLGHGPV